MIANTDYDQERITICVTRMLWLKVDGVAIMTSEMDESLVEVFSRRRIPLVFLDAGTLGAGGEQCVNRLRRRRDGDGAPYRAWISQDRIHLWGALAAWHGTDARRRAFKKMQKPKGLVRK